MLFSYILENSIIIPILPLTYFPYSFKAPNSCMKHSHLTLSHNCSFMISIYSFPYTAFWEIFQYLYSNLFFKVVSNPLHDPSYIILNFHSSFFFYFKFYLALLQICLVFWILFLAYVFFIPPFIFC